MLARSDPAGVLGTMASLVLQRVADMHGALAQERLQPGTCGVGCYAASLACRFQVAPTHIVCRMKIAADDVESPTPGVAAMGLYATGCIFYGQQRCMCACKQL